MDPHAGLTASPARMERLPPQALVIDDNAARRTVTSEVLANQGFQIREASDGARGLALALHLTSDVVVLALALPYRSAVTVLRGIHAAYPARETQVLIRGGYALLVLGDDIRSFDGRLLDKSDYFDVLGQLSGATQRVHPGERITRSRVTGQLTQA
jgi:hypothetical protein